MKTLLMIAVLASSFAFACGGGEHAISDAVREAAAAGGGVPISRDSYQRTPNGVNVLSKSGVSLQQLDLIDAGMTGVFRDARTSGYSAGLDPAFYEILIPPRACTPSPEQHVPSFLLRSDDYDATEFDQYNSKGPSVRDGIGVVYAAELVLSLGTDGSTYRIGQMYVCPDVSVLSDAVRHGGEHIIIANNDSDYYNLTWFHGGGFYHPLLPKRSAPFAGDPSRPAAGSQISVETVR